MNSRGQVIGVAVGSIEKGQNLNFAIPVSSVRSLLTAAGRDVQRVAASRLDGAWDVPIGLAPTPSARSQAPSPSIIGEKRPGETSEVASLRGLGGVYVIVESLDEEDRRYLSQDSIQSATELELRRYGIKILTREQWLESEAGQYLSVDVNIMDHGSGLLVYTIECSLNQSVTLDRDPTCTVTFLVPTWRSRSEFGTVGRARARDSLMTSIVEQVDQFVSAYMKAQ